MMEARKLIVLTAAAFALGVPADPAGAQVFVDPGSPSAKEYAIPLEDARREASGGSDDPVVQGERSAPIFGEGVGDDSSPGSGAGGTTDEPSSSGGNTGGGSDRPGDSGSGSQKSGQAATAVAATRPVGATIPQGGLGSTATIGALALSVLLLGGVIGSIARRRSD
jgi:hypothetical protein